MFAAVLSLGTMTAFAQEEVTAVEEVATEVVEESQDAATEVADEAQEAATEATEAVQDSFNEVALEEVPATITEALEAAHPGATIAKAYLNEEAQYKLEVAKEDGETAELYADAEGNWIEM